MRSSNQSTPMEKWDRETVPHIPVMGEDSTPRLHEVHAGEADARNETVVRVTQSCVPTMSCHFYVGVVLSVAVWGGWFWMGLDFSSASLVGLSLGALIAYCTRFFHRTESVQPSLDPRIASYELIAPIGQGGMGKVFLAKHRSLSRPCAIKILRSDRRVDSQALARFHQEIQMTSRLSHENTVKFFESGRTASGEPYYVMEYLQGMSLDEIVRTQGPLPSARVISLLRQACDALDEAHSLGLIHRDLKPANLFVTERAGQRDVLKVLDFGLVKSIGDADGTKLTHAGMLCGTPAYMSPEQARISEMLDGRSDIYSLGAVAYTLLTGRPPFERASHVEVLIAHARDEVTPPSEYVPEIPGDLEEIVLICLAKDPRDRFATMADLQDALAGCDAASKPSTASTHGV